MKKLKMNTGLAIFDIIDTAILLISWILIIGFAFNSALNGGNSGNGLVIFMYVIQWIGVILHVITVYRSKVNSISMVGGILGIIGCALSGFTLIFAFPSIILLIIATVFLLLQHPSKKTNND